MEHMQDISCVFCNVDLVRTTKINARSYATCDQCNTSACIEHLNLSISHSRKFEDTYFEIKLNTHYKTSPTTYAEYSRDFSAICVKSIQVLLFSL
jgi:transcription elongation factor Elf1